MLQRYLVVITACLLSSLTFAQAQEPAVSKLIKVTDKVYALVGDLGQRSPKNLGNNMTNGFIIGDSEVIVVDTGGSRAGAMAIVAAVKSVTNKPITWAINTGGQDHRWLGNDYFHTVVGAKIISAEATKRDMLARTYQQMEMARSNVGERFEGTKPDYPDTTFDKRHTLPFAGLEIELINTGGAHTPGDILVWLPKEKILFAGDAVFADRLLGIQPKLGLKWIAVLEHIRDEIKPQKVIPGHGAVASLDKAMADSLGYLVMLRDGARKAIAAGAFEPAEVADKLDQSKFSYLLNYDDRRFRHENAYRMAEEVFATEQK
jgi:glyoxylase-like metal-dependent hydrolase (beta-lactamase superfamily II)